MSGCGISHLATLPPGGGGGLRSLIVALLGDFFIICFKL